VKEPLHITLSDDEKKIFFLNKILYQAAAPFSTSSLLMSLVLPSCSQCHQDLFFAADAKGEQNWPIALKSTSGLYYNQGILKGGVSLYCCVDLLFDWFGLVCLANKNKKNVCCPTADSKPLKQEVNSTVMLPL
jgi:hypothetical protein